MLMIAICRAVVPSCFVVALRSAFDVRQRRDRVDRVLARRVHQRGPAAFRQLEHGHAVGLVAVLGEVQLLRPRVQVGAVRGQRLDRRAVVLRGGPHQRRLALPRFGRVDVGAARDQRPDDVGAAGARGGHQHGFAVRPDRVRVGAGLEQRPRIGGVAVGGRERQRRDAVAIRGARRSRRRARSSCTVSSVVAADGPVQRRHAVGFGGVDVRAA